MAFIFSGSVPLFCDGKETARSVTRGVESEVGFVEVVRLLWEVQIETEEKEGKSCTWIL